jgi:hypothetical protein
MYTVPAAVNDKVYIHELIDIRGHHRADYMHHMTANWSPVGQEERGQRCYGVWAVLGSTGRWPQVVNIWEHDGWDGVADSFATEAVGRGAQDPKLEKWWAAAADFRSGGFDRLLVPASWTRTITELCADGVRGECYAHELVTVRPGAARDLLEHVRAHADAAPPGWELVGAWSTAMANDDECVLVWAIATWRQWSAFEQSVSGTWRRSLDAIVTGWHRTLLVDAPLSPFRTGRQPSRSDRTDWED